MTPEQADEALLVIAARSADTGRLALEVRVRLACDPNMISNPTISKAVESEMARLSLDSKNERAELCLVILAMQRPWWRRWWPF